MDCADKDSTPPRKAVGARKNLIVDWRTPEAVLFLKSASEKMKMYRQIHGRYPDTWAKLGMDFRCSGGTRGEAGTRADALQGSVWRPRDCKLTYRISDSTATSFLVEALSDDGRTEYELTATMARPRRIWPIEPLFETTSDSDPDRDLGARRSARINEDPLLSLSVTFSLRDAELVLRYSVENRSERDAYILNGIPYPNGIYDADPNEIYVHLDRPFRAICLNKRIPAIPANKDPEAPIFARMTPVRAHETYAEEVHIALPILESRAYEPGSSRANARRATEFLAVRFTLQYYWRTEGMREDMQRIPKGALNSNEFDLYTTYGGAPLGDRDHGFLESPLVPLGVPVVDGR